MLRTAIILIVTCMALGGAFAIYMSVQPPIKRVDRIEQLPPVSPMPVVPGEGPYHDGVAGMLNQYSKVNGHLSSKMAWDKFTRHKDGTTTVFLPVINLNIAGGQRLTITGETGLIDDFHAPEMTTTSGKQPMGMPDRGTLQHVTICLYPTWDARAQPTIILTTENLAFDNATFRIATAAYTDENGKTIAADEVPVHVTGDYLFDGRGLTVQWNDRDNRLELLEVAHGEQLTIVHPSKAMGPGAPKQAALGISPSPDRGATEGMATILPDRTGGGSLGAAADRRASPPAKRGPQSEMLASTDAASAALAVPATHPAKPPQPPYLARFLENVVVTQGLETKITGDKMEIGFVLKPSSDNAATQPAKPSPDAGASPTTTNPPASPPTPPTGSPSAMPSPAISPATPVPPTEEPVVIHWSGPLRITPAPSPLDLAPGAAVVTISGQPVITRHIDPVQLQTTEAQAATMVYYTADGSVSLLPSSAVPKVRIARIDNSIGDRPIMSVIADNFDFVGRNQEAVFTGPGEAHLPAGTDAGKTMVATWQRSAKIFLQPAGHGQSAVSRAILQGDVSIAHPQLSLQSQQLELRFAPPAIAMAGGQKTGVIDPGSDSGTRSSEPGSMTPGSTASGALRQIIARDSVNCRLTDSAGKKQTIDCQRLDVRTAEDARGNIYPRQLFADDEVHAFDADQELDAGHLELSLIPAKGKPHSEPAGSGGGGGAAGGEQAVALRSLYASDRVKLRGKGDRLATCQELLVDGDPAQGGRVELIGHDALATVTDHQNVLTGPTIVMNGATQQDTIIGPGTLHVIRQAPPGAHRAKPTNPIDIIWSDRAVVDGRANTVDAYGNVEITQVAEDKSIDTAHAPHLRIDLENKPAIAKAPATQPVLVAGPGTDIFKDKQAKSVTLDGGTDIASTLNDPATGALLRDMLLRAPSVVYTLGQSPGQETLVVPSAGQMLVRDYRTGAAAAGRGAGAAASPAAAGTGAAPPAAGDLHGMKGLTAFDWKKSLTYTAADRQAVMLGNVHVKHLDNDQAIPAELFADRVTAHFLAAPAQPTNPPAAGADDSFAGPMQLQDLHAYDNLTITHAATKVTGTSMKYDPATHLLTIFGTPANPVVESGAAATSSTQALTAIWNTETWNIDFTDVMVRGKTK